VLVRVPTHSCSQTAIRFQIQVHDVTTTRGGAYGADDDIVDYILGITFEIWEQRGVELIDQYYGRDVVVYTLEGVTEGSSVIVDGTRAMLASYPDRLLLADDVIWSGSRNDGWYSSHRIVSPMTNSGDTTFGPATGRRVKIMNIADCFVEDGVVTREWLMRDNSALVTQLGFDLHAAARAAAARRDERSRAWIASEVERLARAGLVDAPAAPVNPAVAAQAFAVQVIGALWGLDGRGAAEQLYAPYAVMHRSPISLFTGRESVLDHYADLRSAFRVAGVSVDHVASQARGARHLDLAVRWTVAGEHVGTYLGLPATGRAVFILGSSHYRVVDGRIAVEWTVFDGLGVLSQLV
jgi:predicted ester cyclase